jgi:hypothetical protein
MCPELHELLLITFTIRVRACLQINRTPLISPDRVSPLTATRLEQSTRKYCRHFTAIMALSR